MPAHGTSKRSYPVIALILLFYMYLRILALPADPQHAQGMTHDGSYLTIVAKNLLAGKGFVLDALWLVFLQPDHLPMPYHNSTPLYPSVIAAAARGFHLDVFRAGFLVAALSSAGLIVALTFLLKRYVNRIWPAFMVAFVAALVRSEKPGMAALAGRSLDLAWLTRPAASMVVFAAALCLGIPGVKPPAGRRF